MGADSEVTLTITRNEGKRHLQLKIKFLLDKCRTVKKRTAILISIIVIPFVGGIEIGPGVNILQPEFSAQLEFTDDENFTKIGVYPPVTGLDYSNFSVNPEDTAGVELDFYLSNATRQRYVTNFTVDTEAGSPESVDFNLSGLPSTDFYEAYFEDNGSRIFIGYAEPANSFNFTTSVIEENVSVFNYGEKGVEVSNVSLNKSEPVEGVPVKVVSNLTNEGVVDPETTGVRLDIETWNGTEWINTDTRDKEFTVPRNSSTLANFTWTPSAGPFRFTVEADPQDEIKETNESNNIESTIIDVDSYQILYGGSDSELVLGANNTTIYRWDPEQDVGLLFFADSDSNFGFPDLEPIGDDKFLQVAENLQTRGHNDSISQLWDSNGDGIADERRELDIAGRTLEVPVANSSASNNFKTGLLYDSDQGDPYDGSQDIVIVTEINPSTDGEFDNYDYEVRIPHYLGQQVPDTDSISIYSRLK